MHTAADIVSITDIDTAVFTIVLARHVQRCC